MAESMGAGIQPVKEWRKKWTREGDLVTCKNCGQEFNAVCKTTCPKCRTFL